MLARGQRAQCHERQGAALRGDRAIQQQIDNNLRSVSLLGVVGMQWPGWGQVTTLDWLRAWGKMAGKMALSKLLAEQGARQRAPYQGLVESL